MLCERVRNLREQLNLSQTELAKQLGIRQNTYSRYELGLRVIPHDILCKLADFYDTSVDYLMGRTDERTPYPPSNTKP